MRVVGPASHICRLFAQSDERSRLTELYAQSTLETPSVALCKRLIFQK